MTRAVRADDMEAFRLLGEGQTYADLPEHLQRYRSDIFTDKYKRLAWDELSRTITAHIAKDGYWYIHPEQHRTLSDPRGRPRPDLPRRLPLRRPAHATAIARSATPSHRMLGRGGRRQSLAAIDRAARSPHRASRRRRASP